MNTERPVFGPEFGKMDFGFRRNDGAFRAVTSAKAGGH